ncbi:MAG: DUF2125 domain-containing protein [Pseudomonadota bacterium]
MKKYLMIGGGIIALAAAGWSALWYMGKGHVEDMVAAQAALMNDRGITLNWSDQQTTGFPSGYNVQMTDVSLTNRENGVLLQLGDIDFSVDASNPDRYVVDLSPEIDVTIPTRAELLILDPDLPKAVQIKIASKDLTVAGEGMDPLTRTIDVAAKGLSVTVDQDDFAWKVRSAADDLNVSLKARPQGQLLVFNAGRHLTTFENAADPTQPLVKLDYLGPSMTLEGSAHTLDDFLAQWNSQAADLLSGTFLGAGQEIVISVIDPAVSAEAQVLTYTAGASSGLFGVSGGEASYQAEDREVDLQVYLPGIPQAGLRTLRSRAEAYQRTLTVPVAAETPKNSALRLGLVSVEPDDALWQAIDPGKKLNRQASNLIADLQGTVKYVQPVAGGLPVEFSNVTVQELQLDTLGASAKVAGDVEIIQPINLPYGEFKVDMQGAQALITALSQADLINFQLRQMAEAVLEVYAKKGEGEDTWTTDIVMDHEGTKINGLKLPD